MPDYWKTHEAPYDAIAYGMVTTVAEEVIEDRGITFDPNLMDDTTGGTLAVTVPDGTEELRIRSDAAAGALTLFVNGDESDGCGIPISGGSATDIIQFKMTADAGTNIATLQWADTLGAKYVEITALGMA